MSIQHTTKLGALAALLALAGTAQAASIVSGTSTISGSVITFNEFDGYEVPNLGDLQFTVDLGSGVTFSTTPFATLGANNQDLQDNGAWGARDLGPTPTGDGNFVATAFTQSSGSIGFSFAAPVAQVGAFINQYQPEGTTNNFVTLLAYNQAGGVIDTFTYSVDTAYESYNEGMFLGFSRANADIYSFGVANGTFVLDNLTYSVAAVPEPASVMMLLAGGLGLVAARRKRKNG